MLKKFTNKKGFTLMEMLIVVAIIAILVAIAIPTFAGQLERANQSTDAANIRATYAEVVVDYLNKGQAVEMTTPAMKSGSWDKIEGDATIGDTKISAIAKTKGTGVTIKIAADGTVTIPTN